jgi:hypothetical protein
MFSWTGPLGRSAPAPPDARITSSKKDHRKYRASLSFRLLSDCSIDHHQSLSKHRDAASPTRNIFCNQTSKLDLKVLVQRKTLSIPARPVSTVAILRQRAANSNQACNTHPAAPNTSLCPLCFRAITKLFLCVDTTNRLVD